jgi:hypothetical protein
MVDNSATAVYHGFGIVTANWQTQAEKYNAKPVEVDMTDTSVLENETGECEAFGNHAGDRVVNLTVTKVSGPVKHRSIPANAATNQNALGRGRGK